MKINFAQKARKRFMTNRSSYFLVLSERTSTIRVEGFIEMNKEEKNSGELSQPETVTAVHVGVFTFANLQDTERKTCKLFLHFGRRGVPLY